MVRKMKVIPQQRQVIVLTEDNDITSFTYEELWSLRALHQQ